MSQRTENSPCGFRTTKMRMNIELLNLRISQRAPVAGRNVLGDRRNRENKFYSRSHDAVIRVYDNVSDVIETHEHEADFKEW